MLKDEYVWINGHSKNLNYYRSLGYDVSVKSRTLVKTKDLSHGSTLKVIAICDRCDSEVIKEYRDYYICTNGLKNNFYCIKCRVIKSRQTCVEKYGVDNPMKMDDIKNKLKNSINEKYGVDHFSKTDIYKRKYKETCIEKYGVDNASKSIRIKDTISRIKFQSNNSIEKYRKILPDQYKIQGYSNDREFTIFHEKCNCEFTIFIITLSDRLRYNNIICTVCNPIDKMSSSRELELHEFLESNEIKFIKNSYDVITPLSLDIFIPDKNLAIEFNGIYWHSEIYKDRNYHLNKTNLCRESGIDLIHVWEDDWIYKKDIIKSIILNKLGISRNKIMARKCEIREVSDVKLIRSFLDKNHIQGYSSSKIKIGLYYLGELVSLMIFGKTRKNMELIRFCNKIDTNVVGSASRLFKFFLSNYNFLTIESFSDISIFSGNMYLKLGFCFKHDTKVSYHWVINGKRKHRFNFNKKSLVKSGFDPNLTEYEIMKSQGYYKIFGCGLRKFEFIRKI